MTSTASTFDIEAFRNNLAVVPQFSYIGAPMQVRFRGKLGANNSNNTAEDGAPRVTIEYRGYLGNVTSDVVTLLHSSPAPPSTGVITNDSRLRGLPNVSLKRKSVLHMVPLDHEGRHLDAHQQQSGGGAAVASPLQPPPETLILSELHFMNLPRRSLVDDPAVVLLDIVDAETLLRRWIIQRATGGIPESLTARHYLLAHAGLSVETANDALSRFTSIRSELDQAVSACALRATALAAAGGGGGGGGAGAGGGVVANLFSGFFGGDGAGGDADAAVDFQAINDDDLRTALREQKPKLYTYLIVLNALIGLTAVASLSFVIYTYVQVAVHTRLLADFIDPARVSCIVFSLCCLVYVLIVAYEMVQVVDLQLVPRVTLARTFTGVVMVPIWFFSIITAGACHGSEKNVVGQQTLEEFYVAMVTHVDMCRFFSTASCSGFDHVCAVSGSVCPGGCVNNNFPRPCHGIMLDFVGSFVIPIAVLEAFLFLFCSLAFLFMWKLERLVSDVLAVLRPPPPEPADIAQ